MNHVLALILGGAEARGFSGSRRSARSPPCRWAAGTAGRRVEWAELPACRPAPHLRADAVQLGESAPAHPQHLHVRPVQRRLRRDPGRPADHPSSDWYQGTADAVRQAARHFWATTRTTMWSSPGTTCTGWTTPRYSTQHVERRAGDHDRRAAGDRRGRIVDGHLPLRSRRPDRGLRGKTRPVAPRRDRVQACRREHGS